MKQILAVLAAFGVALSGAFALTDNEALNLLAGTQNLTNNQALNLLAVNGPNLIKLRRDTASNWTSENPILAQGEVGVELSASTLLPHKIKIGDGETEWNDLRYNYEFLGTPGEGSVIRFNADGTQEFLTASQLANFLGVTTDGALNAAMEDPSSNEDFDPAEWVAGLAATATNAKAGDSTDEASTPDLVRQQAVYGDSTVQVFGQEYLEALHKKIMLGPTQTWSAIVSGPSTVAGDSIVDSSNKPDQILSWLCSNYFGNWSFTNGGHSGKNSAEWLADYLPGDIAAAPDLYIISGWEINDGYNNRTDSTQDLRDGLALIRATRSPQQTTVVVVSANPTNDTPNGRDAAWYESINAGRRKAARDYQCVFIDIWSKYREATGTGLDIMDAPYADARRIHPKDVFNLWIWGDVFNVLFPVAIREKYGIQSDKNVLSSQNTVTPSTAPSGYNYGRSRYRTSGFPLDGVVETYVSSDGVAIQRATSYLTSEEVFRTGSRADGWNGTWISMTPGVNTLVSNSAGTAYSLTTTPAAFTFGTTSPSITFARAGTYLVSCRAIIAGNGATVVNETFAFGLRRTNNTPADLTGAVTPLLSPPATTTSSKVIGEFSTPDVIYTASAGDIVQPLGNISANLGAGTINVIQCTLRAQRLY